MNIPIWKRWLSYFTDITLEKRVSLYSGDLKLLLNRGRYALATDKAVYSFEDLYLNFRNSFEKLDLNNFKIQKVLILGAGLLSIPYILEKKHHKKYKYKVVDIDKQVLELARKYALPKLNSEIEFVCADALEYIKTEKEKYGLIIVDLFIDDLVPTVFESPEFLKGLNKILDSEGLLMYNRMTQNQEAEDNTKSFYNNNFSTVFEKTDLFDLGTNTMLLAYGN